MQIIFISDDKPYTTLFIANDKIAIKGLCMRNLYITNFAESRETSIADAANVARLGVDRYEQGMRCEINALASLYLRKSEAEERLMESC